MKKYNVFKVLLIALFVAIIASFLIPKSTVGYTGIEKGEISPITLIDTVSLGLTSFSVFIALFIYILSIGIFYAVIKKTGKYESVINNTAAKFKNKKVFIIISVLTFGLLTSVIGDIMPLLVFVPAFIDVSKKLGYDSKSSIAATVGAIILGSAGSLYTNYSNQILGLTVASNIFVKIGVLAASLAGLIIFILLSSKPKDVKLEKENVKKALPLVLAFDIVLVLIILGMTPWNSYFNFEGFTNFHNAIIDFKVLKISLFEAIVGTTLVAFGQWTTYSLIVLVLVVSVILAIIYKIKIDSFLETVAQGIRKALPYSLILILANVVLVAVYNSGFYITVIASLGKMKDTILSSTTLSALSSVVYPDYTYATQFTLSTLTTVVTKTALYSVIGVIFQLIYSLALLISPTSIILLMALRYEEVRYKDWFKYIYKFFLIALIVFFAVIMIIGGKYVKTISYVVFAVLIVILVLLFVLGRNNKAEVKEVKKTTKKIVTKKKSK